MEKILEKYVYSTEQLNDPHFRYKLSHYKTARLIETGEFVGIAGVEETIDGGQVVRYRKIDKAGIYHGFPNTLTDFCL